MRELGFSFRVPGRPKAWHRPAQGRNGVRFTDPAQKRSMSEIALCAISAKPRDWNKEGPMRLTMLASFRYPQKEKAPVPRPYLSTPDLDNLEKLIKDSLKGIAWVDDKQVCAATKLKTYGPVDETIVVIEQVAVGLDGQWANNELLSLLSGGSHDVASGSN